MFKKTTKAVKAKPSAPKKEPLKSDGSSKVSDPIELIKDSPTNGIVISTINAVARRNKVDIGILNEASKEDDIFDAVNTLLAEAKLKDFVSKGCGWAGIKSALNSLINNN